jgi:hypothetical protein
LRRKKTSLTIKRNQFEKKTLIRLVKN